MLMFRAEFPAIGASWLAQDITRLHSMRVILRSSFSIDKGPSLQVRGGGCGIVDPAGGLQERPGIRSTMSVVSRAAGRRRETGEDLVFMRDIHICFRRTGIWNSGSGCGEDGPGIRHIPVRHAGLQLIAEQPGLQDRMMS